MKPEDIKKLLRDTITGIEEEGHSYVCEGCWTKINQDTTLHTLREALFYIEFLEKELATAKDLIIWANDLIDDYQDQDNGRWRDDGR